jgi:hypothetical protein
MGSAPRADQHRYVRRRIVVHLFDVQRPTELRGQHKLVWIHISHACLAVKNTLAHLNGKHVPR